MVQSFFCTLTRAYYCNLYINRTLPSLPFVFFVVYCMILAREVYIKLLVTRIHHTLWMLLMFTKQNKKIQKLQRHVTPTRENYAFSVEIAIRYRMQTDGEKISFRVLLIVLAFRINSAILLNAIMCKTVE